VSLHTPNISKSRHSAQIASTNEQQELPVMTQEPVADKEPALKHRSWKAASIILPVPLDTPIANTSNTGAKRKPTATTPSNSPVYKNGLKPLAKCPAQNKPLAKQRKTAALKYVCWLFKLHCGTEPQSRASPTEAQTSSVVAYTTSGCTTTNLQPA
jgi:hypothetical protein